LIRPQALSRRLQATIKVPRDPGCAALRRATRAAIVIPLAFAFADPRAPRSWPTGCRKNRGRRSAPALVALRSAGAGSGGFQPWTMHACASTGARPALR